MRILSTEDNAGFAGRVVTALEQDRYACDVASRHNGAIFMLSLRSTKSRRSASGDVQRDHQL